MDEATFDTSRISLTRGDKSHLSVDYINNFRLKAALEYLDDPDTSLTMVELAEMCGFNSISTFRRVFVRAMGCSYVDYRDQVLAQKQS